MAASPREFYYQKIYCNSLYIILLAIFAGIF
jgi:hypothetical protein